MQKDSLLKETIQDIQQIHSKLAGRWKEFQRYQEYQKDPSKFKEEPFFLDEDDRMVKSSKALAPCATINDGLNRYVGLTLQVFPKETKDTLFEIIKTNPNLKKKVDELRQIAIHAEEAMEKEALTLIFKSIGNNPTSYGERIEKFSKRILEEKANINPKTALLKAMTVDFPKWNQKMAPTRYKGLVFKYFDNYIDLVNSEIKLLEKTVNQDRGASRDIDFLGIDEKNHGLRRSKSLSAIKDFGKNNFENMAYDKNNNLSSKTFTFVGAGFPLTGIILHQETGAKVNLVDYDLEAKENAKKLIGYCEELGIVEKGKMDVIHANALDLKYYPTSMDISQIKGENLKQVVMTDILDLASAIPSDVTDSILKNNIHQDVLVRKRNVQGLSNLLYERYELKDKTPYEIASEVTTPQDALNRKDLSKIVALTKVNNVNSCELFVRKGM